MQNNIVFTLERRLILLLLSVDLFTGTFFVLGFIFRFLDDVLKLGSSSSSSERAKRERKCLIIHNCINFNWFIHVELVREEGKVGEYRLLKRC